MHTVGNYCSAEFHILYYYIKYNNTTVNEGCGIQKITF